MTPTESVLEKHKRIWEQKKILRIIYSEWYRKIIGDISPEKGKTIELGAGSGNFKEFMLEAIASDIDPHPWLDMVFDAHQMPFSNNSISNLVMVDVLHHLSNPILFFREAARVLQKKGRVIMLEPYPSPFSLLIYRRFHPEPFIMEADYFQQPGAVVSKDPWDSNQAIPYLLFFKHWRNFQDEFGDSFRLVARERLSCVLYPASGGFENKAMIPDVMIPVFQLAEKLLIPLRPLLAFRCYVVLEKI